MSCSLKTVNVWLIIKFSVLILPYCLIFISVLPLSVQWFLVNDVSCCTHMTANLYLFTTVINHFLLRVIRFMVRHVKYLLGLRFEVSGWEHLQTEGPYVIISNHQSSLDVLGVYCDINWMFVLSGCLGTAAH